MKIKRLVQFASASVLSVSTLMTLGMPLAHAISYSCTWTGLGADTNFSTAANWSGCNGSAPVATDGDSLIFPISVTQKNAVNDLVNATFISVTFNGAGGQSYSDFTLAGNAFTVTGGITDAITSSNQVAIANNITLAGNQTITDSPTSGLSLSGAIDYGTSNIVFNSGYFISSSGVLNGSGNVTKTGNGSLRLDGVNTFSGILNATAGNVLGGGSAALGSTAGATTIGDTASLVIGDCVAPYSIAENITLTGSGANNLPKLFFSSICRGGGQASEVYGAAVTVDHTYNLTGNITLGSDITFGSTAKIVNLIGALSGNFKINLLPEFSGMLVLNGSTNNTGMSNGSYTAPAVVKTLSDDVSANTVSILKNATITIDGKRNDTIVEDGGTLKGIGTVGALSVSKGGTLAPGNSPGCLSSSNLSLGGTYQAEIGGTDPCTGYDQMKVTGTVDVTGGTLVASLYNGFIPKVGQSYTIISNDVADAVTGTFNGIAEGGTYANQGVTYTVTYKGGDGNDVVLTVSAVDAAATPKKPDTGFSLVAAHPMVALATSTLAAGALLVAARKLRPSLK